MRYNTVITATRISLLLYRAALYHLLISVARKFLLRQELARLSLPASSPVTHLDASS